MVMHFDWYKLALRDARAVLVLTRLKHGGNTDVIESRALFDWSAHPDKNIMFDGTTVSHNGMRQLGPLVLLRPSEAGSVS